jgi:hypothetical protein
MDILYISIIFYGRIGKGTLLCREGDERQGHF